MIEGSTAVVSESPPAPHPTVVATMLPPRSFCQDLARGRQRRAPRARELKRRPLGAAKDPCSRSKGVGRAGTCVRPRPLRADSSSNTHEGTGEGGSCRAAQKHRALCADLAKKRIARASDVFISATASLPIKRESPLRQSAHRKKPAVGLSRPQIYRIKGMGSYPSPQRVE